MDTLFQQQLSTFVTQKRGKSLVGLGASVTRHGRLVGTAVSGERKYKSGVQLSVTDKWHMGSITKSFTATMIARLVEQGLLNWDTSIGEIFESDVFEKDGSQQQFKSGQGLPNEEGESTTIHPMWKDVTLTQLLSHRSGAPANFSPRVNFREPPEGEARIRARAEEVLAIISQQPKLQAGQDFLYSNVGYTIAGVMAEMRTGKSWEALIREQVFSPLELTSAGFGPPVDDANPLSQPRGHRKFLGFTVSSQLDNSPIMGPAGSIHLSLQDLAKYAEVHLQQINRHHEYLKKATLETLHRPIGSDYAMGWVKGGGKFPTQDILWHNGSNRMWYSLLVLVPKDQTSIAIVSNGSDIHAARETAWEIASDIYNSLSKDEY